MSAAARGSTRALQFAFAFAFAFALRSAAAAAAGGAATQLLGDLYLLLS